MGRMVLIKRNPDSVYIRDTVGNDVSFDSFAEFEKYTGTKIWEGKDVIYEPEKNLFYKNKVKVDDDSTLYEALISSVSVIKNQKKDKYYLASLQEAIVAKKEEARVILFEKTQEAEINPSIGVTLSDYNIAKQAREWSLQIALIKSNSATLLSKDDTAAISFNEKILNHFVSLNSFYNSLCVTIENILTVEKVKEFDVNKASWPIWSQ